MSNIEQLLAKDPFSVQKEEKAELLKKSMQEAAIFHYENCKEYRHFCESYGFDPYTDFQLTQMPYFHVDLMKTIRMISVPEKAIIATVKSSATTSGIPSSVPIDRTTSEMQRKSLRAIMKSFIGAERKHFIILDSSETVLNNGGDISSRASGIRGILQFSKNYAFVLDKNLVPDIDEIESATNMDGEVCIFGFTYTRQSKILDLYGMTEQLGTVYIDCESGFKHVPTYSEIIIRDPMTYSAASFGKDGFIQLLSPIPHSYPGISVICDDIGMIVGEDDCACGRNGKYFVFKGRAAKAEIKGCGDTLKVT